MDYIQLTMDDYIQCKNEIKESLGGIVKSFVRIGWQLTRINNSEAYKLDGYNTIAEFAKQEYDMTPSGVSRFMSVYERYSAPGDTPELQEQYKDFKFAQLTEMLQLPREDQAMIQPEAKRDDIRSLAKFNKENENNPENLMAWKEEPKDKLTETILEFFKTNRDALNELYASEAYQTGNIKAMVDIVNPSGNRSFRKGTVFRMMYGVEKGIMVKQFGSAPEDITWEHFFKIMQRIFAETAAGVRTWENHFEPEGQKTAPKEKTTPAIEDSKQEPEFAPAQKEPEIEGKSQKTASHAPTKTESVPEKAEEVTKSTTAAGEEFTEEVNTEPEQIPGQDNILNHQEYLPKEEVAPAQPDEQKPEEAQNSEILEKPMTRKEYLDTLTAYGTAEYMAISVKGFRNITYSQLTEPAFWERWLNENVDTNGRPWKE